MILQFLRLLFVSWLLYYAGWLYGEGGYDAGVDYIINIALKHIKKISGYMDGNGVCSVL